MMKTFFKKDITFVLLGKRNITVNCMYLLVMGLPAVYWTGGWVNQVWHG